jgi:hypothetical protein
MDEISRVELELVRIAQDYGAAGKAILNRLYQHGYSYVAKMPESLRPLEEAQELLERLERLRRAQV